jgi:hypothetical protein
MKKILLLCLTAFMLTACGETNYSLYSRSTGLSVALRGNQERAATIMAEAYRRECKDFVVDDAPRHSAALNALRATEGDVAIDNRVEFVRGNLKKDVNMCKRSQRVNIV